MRHEQPETFQRVLDRVNLGLSNRDKSPLDDSQIVALRRSLKKKRLLDEENDLVLAGKPLTDLLVDFINKQ